MATASELVTRISEVTGLEHVTLTRYARFARESGNLSQSGRGRSAAHMSPRDVANLLSCVLVNGVAQEAGEHIRRVNEMFVYYRDADHLDNRHLSQKEQDRLQEVLPIVFDREHSFLELLLQLVQLSIRDGKDFEERFQHSNAYLDGDAFSALVHFEIKLSDDPFDTLERPLDFLFSYTHHTIQPRSEVFRRETQLIFKAIPRITSLMADNITGDK